MPALRLRPSCRRTPTAVRSPVPSRSRCSRPKDADRLEQAVAGVAVDAGVTTTTSERPTSSVECLLHRRSGSRPRLGTEVLSHRRREAARERSRTWPAPDRAPASSRSQDQAMLSRSVRWRSGTSRVVVRSTRRRSASRSSRSAIVITASREAASSIASGRPSSRSHSQRDIGRGRAGRRAPPVRPARSKNSASAASGASGRDREDPLVPDPQRLPGRAQHGQARARLQLDDQVGGRVDDVLAVVQHEQRPPVPEARHDRRGSRALHREADDRRDGGDQPLHVDRGEVAPQHPIARARRGDHRQPGRPARSCPRHPGRPASRPGGGAAACRSWRTSTSRPISSPDVGPGRAEPGGTATAGCPAPRRHGGGRTSTRCGVCDPRQLVDAEVDQRASLDERGGGLPHQDVARAAERHDPGATVHRRTEVVAARAPPPPPCRRPMRTPIAPSSFQSRLLEPVADRRRPPARPTRRRRTPAENESPAVAKTWPPVSPIDEAHELVMTLEGARHRGPVPLPQCGAADDVGEHERHRPGRRNRGWHHEPTCSHTWPVACDGGHWRWDAVGRYDFV